MASNEQAQREIPPGVMARHYNDKANMLEGMAITRLADLVSLEGEVARCHDIIKKLSAELQEAREKIAELSPPKAEG
jgi:hypothetical protein